MELSEVTGVPPNHPRHGWPWLAIETTMMPWWRLGSMTSPRAQTTGLPPLPVLDAREDAEAAAEELAKAAAAAPLSTLVPDLLISPQKALAGPGQTGRLGGLEGVHHGDFQELLPKYVFDIFFCMFSQDGSRGPTCGRPWCAAGTARMIILRWPETHAHTHTCILYTVYRHTHR